MIVGLLFTPTLVMKFKGMYKLNLYGYTAGTLGRLGVVIAGYMGSIPLMLAADDLQSTDYFDTDETERRKGSGRSEEIGAPRGVSRINS